MVNHFGTVHRAKTGCIREVIIDVNDIAAKTCFTVPSLSERSSKMRSHSSGMSALTWHGHRSFNACFLFSGSGS